MRRRGRPHLKSEMCGTRRGLLIGAPPPVYWEISQRGTGLHLFLKNIRITACFSCATYGNLLSA